MIRYPECAINIGRNEAAEVVLETDTGDPVGLYVVTLRGPYDTITTYVLAEDEEGAIDQAKVGPTNTQNNPDYTYQAYRIPVRLRGWSDTEF